MLGIQTYSKALDDTSLPLYAVLGAKEESLKEKMGISWQN